MCTDQRYRLPALAHRLGDMVGEMADEATRELGAGEPVERCPADHAEDLVWDRIEAELDERRIRLGHLLRQQIGDDRDEIRAG
jgi:hypothetical protein